VRVRATQPHRASAGLRGCVHFLQFHLRGSEAGSCCVQRPQNIWSLSMKHSRLVQTRSLFIWVLVLSYPQRWIAVVRPSRWVNERLPSTGQQRTARFETVNQRRSRGHGA
jgi:hypothetical protein